jgi:predicted lipid carrier protein YhbT
MQTAVNTRLSSPVFPRPLSLPFALLPNTVHSRTVVTVLNRVFASDLREGELDYLQDRSVRIHIQDMQLTFSITLQQGRLAVFRSENKPDLSITGTLHAFLLLATRREDTDTLFFQRRLSMEGDTELGLEVKNFLDGVDMESLWLSRQLETVLQRALSLYERVLG